MAEKRVQPAAALSELRERLTDALARSRLTKTDLAAGAKLSRTTVSEAFQNDSPVPSAATVAALARTLRLPMDEMLALRRMAAGEAKPAATLDSGPGRPIGEWHPHDLEVHPAGPTLSMELSGYVSRAHDLVLAEAVRHVSKGKSRMLMLIGSSSTGKTRACWEAVQPLAAEGWRLWHPFDPTRAHAALADLRHVLPRTVVWLNEAQHYLGDPRVGEQIAAAVHGLLTEPARGPVLVLGTLWPEYAMQYTDLPRPNEVDPHSRTRELLAGRTVTVAEAFDQEALLAAATLAETGDGLLAQALKHASDDGRVTQNLAGAPELLRCYENGTPPVRALLAAAMDARRLGVGLHLPQGFLIDAAADYLDDHDYDELTEDWAEAAFAELARPVHGKRAPLRRTAPRPRRQPPSSRMSADAPLAGVAPVFRLADYLEQHGRSERERLCPPASFWAAAYTHLTRPADLGNLAKAARSRLRLQWAHHLFQRAADVGDAQALVELAEMRKGAGDARGTEAMYEQAAHIGHPDALMELAKKQDSDGHNEGATALYQRAADAGSIPALLKLAETQREAGDVNTAEALYQKAVNSGYKIALLDLAELRGAAGDVETAKALYEKASDVIDPVSLVRLMDVHIMLAQAQGRVINLDGSDVLYQRAADSGDPIALVYLAKRRLAVADISGAEALYQQIIESGDANALLELAHFRLSAGDVEGAKALFRQAADGGNTTGMLLLATLENVYGDSAEAEAQYRRAADVGDLVAVQLLANARLKLGDAKGAEQLYQSAIDAGDTRAVLELARMREEAGDISGAEALYLEAANAGQSETSLVSRWPYGLDADGTPSAPWR
ncbi:helix-turn-helix domain-containing protein [Streptomyces sp. SUK 48]|uniref:helix-turn-helix domain-containing protein n=1 Tax=Streptomyces sp. SUK 48 TaxID=2582831 RepID=UPI00189166E0|nr:helix-turn-helix domain-containing protein [Streptomyces sp. SUK 48]